MSSNIETKNEHPKVKLTGTIEIDSFGNYNIKKNTKKQSKSKSTQTESKPDIKLKFGKCKKNIFTCCLKMFKKDTFQNKI